MYFAYKKPEILNKHCVFYKFDLSEQTMYRVSKELEILMGIIMMNIYLCQN